MALLRHCGRLVQAFGKLPVSCQLEYIGGSERVARTQGYVTVVPKPSVMTMNSEKLEPSSNINASDITSSSLPIELQRRLMSLCLNAKNSKMLNDGLLRVIESYTVGKATDENPNTLSLLRYCREMLPYVKSSDRSKVTSHLWKFIGRDASKLTVEHYNTLLIIHAENDHPVEPQKFLSDMVVEPDIATYELLMNVVTRSGDVDLAFQITSRMKNEGHSLNEGIFNMLILVHAMNKDIKSVLSTLETMKNARIEPSVKTYTNLACGYASVGDIHNIVEIVNANPLNTQQIMEIVSYLSSSNYGKHIPNVLKYVSLPVHADSIFLNTLSKLTHSGRPEDAFEVINSLTRGASTEETDQVFNSFLKDMVQAKTPSSIVLRFMNTIMTVKNYPLAIMDLGEAALRTGNRELSLAVFEAMHDKKIPLRPHYYWPLLIQSSRGHGESGVLNTMRHMLCLNIEFDHDTLCNHVLPYIDTVDPLITLRKLVTLGLETSVVFTPLICNLLNQGKIMDTLSLCSKIKTPIDFNRVLPYLSIAYKISKNIKECVKMFKFAQLDKCYPEQFLLILFGKTPGRDNAQLLAQFLDAFKESKIPMLNFTAMKTGKGDNADGHGDGRIVNPLNSAKPYNKIPHPNDMSLEELECHFIELKAKGMNLRGVMRKLLQINCRENHVKRVAELKKEYDENGFEWTPGMYSNLLQLYVNTGRLEEAMTLYSQILDYKDFKIDDFKIISLATGLVNANMISEAFKVLESTPARGGAGISKNCWRLLDTVAHSSSSAFTESMLEVLVNAGYCTRSNSLLGPLVRVHLLTGDLTAAVDTFTKCAKRYGHAPLRQELVYALVESMNTNTTTKDQMMQLLEEVQSVTANLRGVVNTKIDLINALARFGMTDELRKYLQNNHVPENLLKDNLSRLPENYKLLILTTMLDVSTEIPEINRSFLCYQILLEHSKFGDCVQATELWKKLSAENIPVSRTFKTVFASLLRNNKYPLPENFSATRFDE